MSGSGLRPWLGAEIAAEGPVPVERYMRECLLHPDFGYYRTRTAIGAAGDFITAPEISQVFGELIGIWTAAAWAMLGEPRRWRLVELGPGRGTLVADLLRTLRVLPAARAGLEVVLVEANPMLIEQQRAALAGCGVPVQWAAGPAEGGAVPLAGLPPLPTVVIANEFLDALPIRQLVAMGGAWHERCVDVVTGGDAAEMALSISDRTSPPPSRLPGEGPGRGEGPQLCFVAGAKPVQPHTLPPLPEARAGSICEVMSGAEQFIRDLTFGLANAPHYALFIDYGHEGPLPGDTLQAVCGHAYAHPLAAPGEHDLSAQVDFAQVAATARSAGLTASPLLSQGEFLGRLGAAERLERLARGKDAATVQSLQLGLARLMQPDGMGGRFKVLALASKGLASPPVF